MKNIRLVIAGCGGLGQEVLWAARRAQCQVSDQTVDILGFCAEIAPPENTEIAGLPFLGLVDSELLNGSSNKPTHFICAIGDNLARRRICGVLETMGLEPWTVIDPSAIVSPSAKLGLGTYLAPGSIISNHALLENHVIVNLNASVGHDCHVGMFAQLCPGSRLSGNCIIGAGAFLGTNAALAPGRRMGHNSLLGGGSFCAVDIPDSTTALATPARLLPVRPV